MKRSRSENQSGPHFFSLASRIPVTELPVHHRDRRLSETPICLDMLSCDSIRLRNSAPLMDELNVCLCTLKAVPDLITNRSLWPCQCPSCSHLLTRSLPDFNHTSVQNLLLPTFFCCQSQRDTVFKEIVGMSYTVKTPSKM